MKKIFFLILIISALTVSCTKKTIKTNDKINESTPKKITIGFSLDTLAIERWQRDMDIFINKLKELDADVIVQNAGNSVEEQNRQLLYLMERNVDVIVVLPKRADSITESIQKIKNKGIPVISYDRLTLNADIDLYLTIDSEKVGENMARGLIRKNPGNKWFSILGPEEDYNMTLISKGISKVINQTGINIVHTYYTSDWNYDLSYQEMNRLLSNKNIPDAIICGNDAIAASVIQSITEFNSDLSIPICGQDADIAACQNIVQDKQAFTIYKPIPKLAEIAAEYAVYLAKKEDISTKKYPIRSINNGFADIPAIWLEPVTVDKSNIDEVIISSNFHSYDSIYVSDN